MTTVNYNGTQFNLTDVAKVITVYADAARADEALILSSGITTNDARVNDSGEGLTGVIRWLGYGEPAAGDKPLLDNSSDASLNSFMNITNYSETYVKNVDVVAAKENSIQSLASKVDGLNFLGRQFGAVRARREDENLRNILAGVGLRVLHGAGNLTSNVYAPSADAVAAVRNSYGYVTEYTHTGTSWAPLFVNENTNNNRSAFFDVLLDAMSAVSGEFEEPFYYLVISPATFNILRKQNVLDINPVQDGNLSINTLLGGKIRLIVTGNTVGAVDVTGTTLSTAGLRVSYLLKSGAFAYANVAVNNPTAIDTNVVTNRGFGDVSIVSRWGNIIHPRGYSWASATTFPTNTQLAGVNPGWTTNATNVNQTGIFPIFHG